MCLINKKKHLLYRHLIKNNILYLITLQMINVVSRKFISILAKML